MVQSSVLDLINSCSSHFHQFSPIFDECVFNRRRAYKFNPLCRPFSRFLLHNPYFDAHLLCLTSNFSELSSSFALIFSQEHSMLSASQCGARSPLSPLTQSTLEKHLPGLTPKRFLQRNKPSTSDVGCITGNICQKCILEGKRIQM